MQKNHDAALLEIKNLSFSTLWNELDFSVNSGEILHIKGINGSGKTSLIKVLCGLTKPDNGTIYWQKKSIYQQPETYHKEIAYIAHQNGIKNKLTPQENLTFALTIKRSVNNADKGLIKNILNQWQLAELPCGVLSAGQQRRVALARLQLAPARLWFLDEPLTALDYVGVQILYEVIAQHLKSGGAVVMSSHQPLDWSFPCQTISLVHSS